MRKAERAQRDVAAFFELVMRHENTKERLKVAAHQRILFSFVQAHERVVLRLPIDSSKMFSVTAMALWLTGNDVTQRGAIVSHSHDQAKKILKMIKDYLEDKDLGAGIRVVFPHLRRSQRAADPWSQKEITVDRPPGTRDPSVRALGINGKIHGSRLSWVLCDDLIDDTNSHTPIERENLERMFTARLMSRMDLDYSRIIVTNTPWDRQDLTYYLEEKMGFATLTMNVDGDIRFSNAKAAWVREALDNHLRPSTQRVSDDYDWYRLTAHDPDPQETTPLWPERRTREKIEKDRAEWLPHEFARLQMCEPFDEGALRCDKAWVELCKRDGVGLTLQSSYDGDNPTFTGVDLAIGKKRKHDKTIFYTYELQPDRRKRILDIESGRLKGPEIVDKIIAKSDAYNSIVGVENNAAQQYILDFASEARKDLRIRAHNTQVTNKLNREFGIESIFGDMRAGCWIIPCSRDGTCDEEVQKWINECLYYQPDKHSGDRLVASWIASELSRRGRKSRIKGSVGRPRTLHRRGQF
jgi:hypothetical protein